jgi:hypothetical protein
MNRPSGIENPTEDVFVVGNSHDHLNDEFPSTGNFRSSVAEVGMLPTNTGINLMKADCILHLHRLSLFIVDPSIEVFDDTKTITPESEIVGGRAGAALTEIVGRLAMIRRSWVAVRDSHLSQGETVEDRSVIVADISEDDSFSVIECQSKFPLLPSNDFGVMVVNRETNTLRLRDV